MEKPVAIVLGGTTPHAMLIDKLHERGYYVVLIDYLPNPPAKRVADEHLQISTLDKEKVLATAKERDAKVVVSACIDHTNSVCCYVAEKLGLPHPYSYETSLYVTNKGLMKARMKESGVPSSSYILSQNVDDIDWNAVSFPCVVKPVDGNSSKGVHRADSIEEAKQYVQEDINMSRAKTAIIEDFCPGDEIQVDCVALDDDAEVVMTRSKVKDDLGEGSVLNSVGSIVPAQIPEKLIPKLKVIAKNIANGFGLRNTPFFYQAIVTGDKVNVLEFTPRVGGGLSFYMIKNFVGFDAVEAAMVSYMGLPINFEHHPINGLYRTGHLYSKPCTFDHIEGIEELKQEGIIHEYFTAKSKGDEIDGDMRSGNRVASYIVKATNLDELNRRITLCKSRIRVIDERGNNVIL